MLKEIILFSSLLQTEAPPSFSSFATSEIKAEKAIKPDPPIFKHREVLDKFKPDVKIKEQPAPTVFKAQDKFGQMWESRDKNALDAFINSRNSIIINPPQIQTTIPYTQPQSYNTYVQPCNTLTG